jgi:putative flavoprotein involved in K+ transport
MPKGSDGPPTYDEVIAYFATYEARYALPIQRPVRVHAIRRDDGALLIESYRGTYRARVVISATGTWSTPSIPPYPGQELFRGIQIHSADYRTPELFFVSGAAARDSPPISTCVRALTRGPL